jgi:hypothetical protein
MDHYFLTLMDWGGPLCTIQRFKATCGEALSNVAFNFNLRRYTKGVESMSGAVQKLAEELLFTLQEGVGEEDGRGPHQ